MRLWKYFGFRSSDGKTVDATTKDAVFCKIPACPKPEMKYNGNSNTLIRGGWDVRARASCVAYL